MGKQRAPTAAHSPAPAPYPRKASPGIDRKDPMADPNNPTLTATPALANPYAAPRAVVLPEADLDEAELATRYQRLRAAIIDYLIFLVPAAIGMLPMAFSSGRMAGPALAGIALGGLTFVAIVALNGFLLAKRGQTVGKKAVGIRVVRTNGDDAGFIRLFFLRGALSWLLATIPFVGAIYALLDILFIFRADRRCLHDLIADTKVVEAD